MPKRSAVNYVYDGSLYGFYSCVFYSFNHKEIPNGVFCSEEQPVSFFNTVEITTEEQHAKRVEKGVKEKLATGTLNLVKQCFLSDTANRELMLLEFLHYCFNNGKSSPRHLGEDCVVAVHKAAQRCRMEAHNYKGFVRFTQREGVLVSEIKPCCRVLPLIKNHFLQRFPNERLMIIDATHNDVLLQSGTVSGIIPFENIELQYVDENEQEYADLWRCFFKTIAIEQRYNRRCQMSHLPLRYRDNMTEFSTVE